MLPVKFQFLVNACVVHHMYDVYNPFYLQNILQGTWTTEWPNGRNVLLKTLSQIRDRNYSEQVLPSTPNQFQHLGETWNSYTEIIRGGVGLEVISPDLLLCVAPPVFTKTFIITMSPSDQRKLTIHWPRNIFKNPFFFFLQIINLFVFKDFRMMWCFQINIEVFSFKIFLVFWT